MNDKLLRHLHLLFKKKSFMYFPILRLVHYILVFEESAFSNRV